MPPTLTVNSSLPALAHRMPLTAALLSSWDHAGFMLGSLHESDAIRMDETRINLGLPSALFI